jgi:hypothetical protein
MLLTGTERARRIEQTDVAPPSIAAIASSFYIATEACASILSSEALPVNMDDRSQPGSKVVSRGSDRLALLVVDSLLGYCI